MAFGSCSSPEIFLKLDLILDLFLAEILRIVVSGDVWICLRIEFIVINTIYNTSQAVGPCIEKTIQLFTVEWCFDLLCVSITYCGDRICKILYRPSGSWHPYTPPVYPVQNSNQKAL